MLYSLPKSAKILKPKDYQAVFKNGKRKTGSYWQVVSYCTNQPPRLGLSISKKIHKLAVTRNRYKRIAREIFRLNQSTFQSLDYVITAKRSQSTDKKALAQDLHYLFQQINQP
jgi:ribonuclease P protein component